MEHGKINRLVDVAAAHVPLASTRFDWPSAAYASFYLGSLLSPGVALADLDPTWVMWSAILMRASEITRT